MRSAAGVNRASRRFNATYMFRDETARVTRRTGARTWDEETGQYEYVTVTVYEGGFFEFTHYGYESTREAGGRTVALHRSEAWFPVGSFASQPGDVVEVVSSVADPMRVGRRMVLAQEAPLKTFEDAYRIFIDREPKVVEPEEVAP